MNDRDLQRTVLDELKWEPSVDAAHIGVTAKDGVVTLTGHVGNYGEKLVAERAARRVKGVKAIAQEIEVRLPNMNKQADDEIAKRAIDILRWNSFVPNDRVQVKVEHGLVTLTGEVDWQYQKARAESEIRFLSGVTGVLNNITVKPQVKPAEVREKIKTALDRNADLEASSIVIAVDGGKVTLNGKVRSWSERSTAENAAWSAPGVTQVVDNLAIQY